jgi:glycosyltransferase involved in cell wall biosynthesis
VITDGVDGYYCAVGDVDGMAARAIEVLGDDSKLATMGKAARRTAQDRFCTTRIIPKYEELYRGLLERRS